jgi:hypothetical protein
LKSNAGQINRTFLQKAAADVEHCLKDGNNTLSAELLNMLEKELKLALSQLEAESETDGADAPQDGPLDEAALRELFDKLATLLKMGNPECCGYINTLRRVPESDTLIRQMEDFDFELAAATLSELRKKT